MRHWPAGDQAQARTATPDAIDLAWAWLRSPATHAAQVKPGGRSSTGPPEHRRRNQAFCDYLSGDSGSVPTSTPSLYFPKFPMGVRFVQSALPVLVAGMMACVPRRHSPEGAGDV